MSWNRSKLIAFNYFGGKFMYTKDLYSYFPNHEHFIDVFCGSLSVTLNKPASRIETVNDISKEIIIFFRVLREQPEELIARLYLTPVSRDEYNQSWNLEGYNDMEIARRFYIRCRQSFVGLGAGRKNKGWHLTVKNSRSNIAETVSRWNNGIEKLLDIIDRLREIQFESRDFRNLISTIDYKDAFFYCDPPYPMDARGSGGDYKHEFSKQDHEDLSEMLHNIKGKAMISGYESPTMDKFYGDWLKIVFPLRHQTLYRKNKLKFECIWMNYDPRNNTEGTLFGNEHEK